MSEGIRAVMEFGFRLLELGYFRENQVLRIFLDRTTFWQMFGEVPTGVDSSPFIATRGQLTDPDASDIVINLPHLVIVVAIEQLN